jgi:hypothetical protein
MLRVQANHELPNAAEGVRPLHGSYVYGVPTEESGVAGFGIVTPGLPCGVVEVPGSGVGVVVGVVAGPPSTGVTGTPDPPSAGVVGVVAVPVVVGVGRCVAVVPVARPVPAPADEVVGAVPAAPLPAERGRRGLALRPLCSLTDRGVAPARAGVVGVAPAALGFAPPPPPERTSRTMASASSAPVAKQMRLRRSTTFGQRF